MTSRENFCAQVSASCKMTNVVYLIERSRCRKQYVGETKNALHLHMNGHHSDYNRKCPDKPVAVHFNTSGHVFEDMKVMVIEQMGSASTARRKHREGFWIYMYTL